MKNNTVINKQHVETKMPPLQKNNNVYYAFKRMEDVLLSAAAVFLLAPLFVVVSIIIVIDSPGAGPIFVQKRVGKNGKEFEMYKFRSMLPGAESKLSELTDKNEMDGPAFKIKDDPRITRFGKIIRKTCIDELPQLFNVIKGDMSIVGPRPALPCEVEKYGERELQRLSVLPGLSCYWQIEPDKNNLKFSEWMDLDLKYIAEQSFLTDWKIIFRTFSVCIKGCGI